MTIATVEQKVDSLRQEIAALRQEVTAFIARLPAPVPVPVPIPVPVPAFFVATFSRNPFRTGTGDGESDDHVWWVEQKADANRATIAAIGRDVGGTGLRLHTEPGDNNISGSGASERNDVALRVGQERHEGDEDWWAHSILFPDDFAIPPPGHWATVFDFHDLPAQTDKRLGGQANFHIFVDSNGKLTFRGNGGPDIDYGPGNRYTYTADVGQIIRNAWFDFVYHVRWSSGPDGFFEAWLNGKRIKWSDGKLTHQGPTLYANCAAYLKLANYHSAWGKPSSVIHDRVVRGQTWQSVSLTSLEGVAP